MINSIRAEFRKLTTVRSTYIITLIACAVAIFFSYYIFGLRSSESFVTDPYRIRDSVFLILNNTMFLIGLVALLLFTHEYRYNLINYTLTSTRDRLNTLVAKSVVIAGYAFVFAFLMGFLTIFSMYFGLSVAGVESVQQNLDITQLLWRGLFGAFGIAMFGLIMGGIIRNQVGAIVTFLIGPGVIESLLTLAIKSKAVYLPFTSLNQVMFASEGMNFDGTPYLSPGRSALVVLIYIVLFWLIMLFLFKKRDAN